jgi:hypothetical protein
VRGAWKAKAALKQAIVVPGTNKHFVFWARLYRIKAAATYKISHTGQAPARVVWKMFACRYYIFQALYIHCNRT